MESSDEELMFDGGFDETMGGNDVDVSLGEEWQDMVECPVCFLPLSRPKNLNCGHCVCENCELGLMKGSRICCPTCRKKTTVPAEGLPVNFILRNVIKFCQQKKENDSTTSVYNCVTCGEKGGPEKMWLCETCDSMFICGTCACDVHRDHEIERVVKVIEHHKEQIYDLQDHVQCDIMELEELDNVKHSVKEVRNKVNKLTRDAQTCMNHINQDVNQFILSFDSSEIQPELLAKKRALKDVKKKRKQIMTTMRSVKDMVDQWHLDVTHLKIPPRARKRHAATPILTE